MDYYESRECNEVERPDQQQAVQSLRCASFPAFIHNFGE